MLGLRKQRGAATLFIALGILLILSIGAAYVAKGTVNETKLISNSVRAKEAQEAAEGALHAALAYYDLNGATASGIGVNSDIVFTATNGSVGRSRFCTPANVPNLASFSCVAPTSAGGSRLIFSVGTSADGSAVRRVILLASEQSVLNGGPKAPLVSKGATSTSLTGNLTVVNNQDNLTIWTGTNIATTTGSFETKITVDGVANQISSKKSGSSFLLGPDVVYNDFNLGTATPLAFQEALFGRSAKDMASIADVRVDLAKGESIPTSLTKPTVVYVYRSDGAPADVTINSAISGNTNTNYMVLVTEGQINFNGNFNLFGVLYGNTVKATGTGTVKGAVYAESIDGGNGNFTIEMEPIVIAGAGTLRKRAPVNGTWRDW